MSGDEVRKKAATYLNDVYEFRRFGFMKLDATAHQIASSLSAAGLLASEPDARLAELARKWAAWTSMSPLNDDPFGRMLREAKAQVAAREKAVPRPPWRAYYEVPTTRLYDSCDGGWFVQRFDRKHRMPCDTETEARAICDALNALPK